MTYVIKDKKYGGYYTHGDGGVNRVGSKEYHMVNSRAGGTKQFRTREDALRYIKDGQINKGHVQVVKHQSPQRKRSSSGPFGMGAIRMRW